MREFCISVGGIAVTNNTVNPTTLIFVNPTTAPNVNLEFLRYWIGQAANATSAQKRCQIVTQVTAFPTLASTSPVKLKFADPNGSVISGNTTGAAGTSGTNATTEGAGTKTIVMEDAFNVLNGWLHVPTPPETRVMPAGASSGQGLIFPSAPDTLTGWSFGLIFREV